MSFSIGIVGLPNVGKSTLFKALTKKQVNISNYPFCTVDPNVGVVAVPDKRLDKLAQVLKPTEVLPTTIEFVDIAGLVKGAHQGEGLGNQFLSHIREVDAICHVVRHFQDENVTHVTGKVDPASDIETINLELVMADFAIVDKRLEEIKARVKTGDKEAEKIMTILEKIKAKLETSEPAAKAELSEEEKQAIKDLNLLTLKPMLIVLNVNEKEINQGALAVAQLISAIDLKQPMIPLTAKIESELAELTKEERQEYIKELGLEKSGLDQLITASYKLLDLITFFTCQNNILQAWTVPQGTKAPQAAGRVHTDFEQGFIKAEITNWQDLVGVQNLEPLRSPEHLAREKGLLRTEGKEYIVRDGDMCLFRFNK